MVDKSIRDPLQVFGYDEEVSLLFIEIIYHEIGVQISPKYDRA